MLGLLGSVCWNLPSLSGTITNSEAGKGRFSHVADVAYENTLLIVGGYRGNVLGDMIAYTVPKAISKNWVRHYTSPSWCLLSNCDERDERQWETRRLEEFSHS